MSTDLNIDDDLLAEAMRLGGKKTKHETVNEALEEYVRRRRRRKHQDIITLFGKVDFDPKFEYKKSRRRR